MKKRVLIDPEEIVAILVTCPHCRNVEVRIEVDSDEKLNGCPQCQERWWPENSGDPVSAFLRALKRLGAQDEPGNRLATLEIGLTTDSE